MNTMISKSRFARALSLGLAAAGPLTAHLRTLSLAFAVIGTLAAQAHSQPRYRNDDFQRQSREHWTADGNLVDVQVEVAGNTTPLYFRPDRGDRHYFQAFQGQNYSLVLRNTTGERVGVVISVDGLNVVNGERSALRRDEAMYVLDPWETTTIRGWRTSLREVRRFVFVDEERSYAESTGQANGDMGWIRVATFRESHPYGWRGVPRYRNDEESRRGGRLGDELNEAPPSLDKSRANSRQMAGESAAPSAPESAPGTGWGDRRHDPVQQTNFRAERQASDQLVLRYEYASGLRAIGIFPARNHRIWDRERGEMGFAQPPRRW